nr:Stk1 family PASTA domain-containing Ser/Thr kinase [Actinotalea soli]
MDSAPRILGGRYEVGELIGRGGMAEVHIGHDTRLGRTVAIKILRSDLARDPSFQARFRREAQAAASLNHPAIVAVYDTGEDVFTEAGGSVAHVPFIVMEYVEGHTVRDILRDGSAVPIEEAVEIAAGVLSALEYSHHAGIVHRDIKPANVMLTPTGAVKVMDFGIARAMADSAGTMTQTQAVIGTAQYLSPEQARGEQVDSRSDLYSTGCLLFELLTGRPPFIGDSPVAVAYQHAREEAQPPSTYASDVPESLDRITMKSLAKNRDDRYSSAAEFRTDLEAAVRGGNVTAPMLGLLGAAGLGAQPADATQVMGAASSPTQVMPWQQTGSTPAVGDPDPEAEEDEEKPKRRWVLWVLIAIAVAAIVGIILVLTSGGETEPETVAVPDVVNMEEALAREEIEDAGLEFEPVAEASTEVEEGRVISTDPGADEEVEVGSTVRVAISQGPDAVEVPTVENFTESQARAELAELGFENISIQTENHRTIERDRVTRTDPAAGESVAPSAQITIYLSTGQVTLPDLVGMTEDQARTALSDLSLSIDLSREESDAETGTVIRQGRSPGPVEQRATISIVIAEEAGPEEVQVPDVYNLLQDDAEARMGNNSLNSTIVEQFDEDVVRGRVFRTEPAAGASVPEGSTVTIYVSRGPEESQDNSNNGNGNNNGEGDGD